MSLQNYQSKYFFSIFKTLLEMASKKFCPFYFLKISSLITSVAADFCKAVEPANERKNLLRSFATPFSQKKWEFKKKKSKIVTSICSWKWPLIFSFPTNTGSWVAISLTDKTSWLAKFHSQISSTFFVPETWRFWKNE